MQALNNSRGIRATLAFAALAASVVASAAVQTSSFDSRVGNVDLQTGLTSSYSLDGYTGTGTLTSLTYSFSGDVFSKVTYSNPVSSGNQSLTSNIDYSLRLVERSSGATILDLSKMISDVINPLSHNSSGTLDYSLHQDFPLVSVTITDPNILALASSQSKFFFDLTSRDGSYTDFSGLNGGADYNGTMRVQGMVTYNSQPVPEPASCAALGLGALGVLRRRARKNAR